MENRLRAARTARRLTQRQLAARVGTTLQQISRLERGERRLTLDWVHRLATALDCPELELLGGGVTPTAPIMVRGAVEADAWHAQPEWPGDRWYPVPVPADRRFAEVARFGLVVRGGAMNRRYPDGSILICVGLERLASPPAPGHRVICHRRRPADGRLEVTARDLRHHDGRTWLWFDSTAPEHQQPIPLDQAAIVALVTGSFSFESVP